MRLVTEVPEPHLPIVLDWMTGVVVLEHPVVPPGSVEADFEAPGEWGWRAEPGRGLFFRHLSGTHGGEGTLTLYVPKDSRYQIRAD